MREKVVITGCAGYIGSQLSSMLLEEGYYVTGIDNFKYNNASSILHLIGENFNFHNLDVRRLDQVKTICSKADIIIPLAALVGEPICKQQSQEASEVNLRAIRDLLRTLSSKQRVIYPNTNSGYGINTEGECTENSPLNPISHYGVTKCEAEKCILDHGGTSLRLATVCGASPRMRMDLMVNTFAYDLLTCANNNSKFRLYEPNFKRNFVYIKDVCEAFSWVIQQKLAGVYNIGNPNANMTKIELAKFICGYYNILEDVIEIAEGSDPDKRDYIVSNQKILSTGFRFHYPIQYALKDILCVSQIFSRSEIVKMRNV